MLRLQYFSSTVHVSIYNEEVELNRGSLAHSFDLAPDPKSISVSLIWRIAVKLPPALEGLD